MARRRGGRGLSDEDRELWSRVTAGATPLHPPAARRDPDTAPHPAALPRPVPRVPDPAPRPPAPVPAGFRVGQAAGGGPAPHKLLAGPAERLREQPVRMDHKTHRQLTRGKLAPEARIDLHGMTLAAAKAELTGFILSAQASGRRLVLVITGKGKGDHGPLPTRSGALRHEVPHWLHMAPLAGCVMQVVPAHLRHGGGGAYYVYLRRIR